jgi:hypothetical protein
MVETNAKIERNACNNIISLSVSYSRYVVVFLICFSNFDYYNNSFMKLDPRSIGGAGLSCEVAASGLVVRLM